MFFPLDLLDTTSQGYNYSQQHDLIGKYLSGRSEQAAAADLTENIRNCAPLLQNTGTPKIHFVAARACAAGESMTIDITRTRAGVTTSILTGLFTYGGANNTAGELYSLTGLIDPTKVSASLPLLPGDTIAVIRDYTAGGGPTPMGPNAVVFEPAPTITRPNGS